MEPRSEGYTPQITIQRLGQDQWQVYRGLRHEMLQTDPAAFPPQAFADLEAPEEKWRANIEGGIVLVAFDGEKPSAIVRGTYDGDVAIARNMYTRLTHRGMGVGKQLMAELLTQFEAEGIAHTVRLEVEDTQTAARRMYGQFGFVETGRVAENKKFMITMERPLYLHCLNGRMQRSDSYLDPSENPGGVDRKIFIGLLLDLTFPAN